MIQTLSKAGLIIASIFLVYRCGQWLFDIVFNGALADWIWNNLMEEQTIYVDTKTGNAQILQPYWPAVKSFIMSASVMVLFIMAAAMCVSCYFYGRSQRKKEIQKISRIIALYMDNDMKGACVLEPEYAAVETQLVQQKSRMQHHEQLIKEEADKKNDLITYLAHDLKTPLTSVVGYLSLLDEVRDMPGNQREKYTHVALEKAERLEKLINEFFEITRYNLTHIVLEKETINLYYMLVQMTDEFYPLLHAHGNTIVLNADETLEIYADPEKLARVFNNILKNAVAYSYEGTPVTVTAERMEDGCAKICFANRGRTIPSQKLMAIFDKFYRMDDARATNSGGAGLGLAIAKEIVRLHDGIITAASEDETTTFEIVLPGVFQKCGEKQTEVTNDKKSKDK